MYNNKFDLFKDSSNSAKAEAFNKKNHFFFKKNNAVGNYTYQNHKNCFPKS